MMEALPQVAPRRPRLGFLGVGWIGQRRMRSILEHDVAVAVAVADPAAAVAQSAAGVVGGCRALPSLDALLEEDLDGVVIATPSALHAEQAIRALERGVAVFCQKPLGRSAAEAQRVVDAARAADRLLGVDLSYRHVAGMDRLRELVQEGALGRVFAVNLVFHNAYGPGKPWLQDARLSGGGCLIDLGIHLLDLALWTMGFPEVKDVTASLRAEGGAGPWREETVEDYAATQLELAGGAVVQLACSWRLAAGQDCQSRRPSTGRAGAPRSATCTDPSSTSWWNGSRALAASSWPARPTTGAGAPPSPGPRRSGAVPGTTRPSRPSGRSRGRLIASIEPRRTPPARRRAGEGARGAQRRRDGSPPSGATKRARAGAGPAEERARDGSGRPGPSSGPGAFAWTPP